MTSRLDEAGKLAARVAGIIDEKKGLNIVVLEMPRELAITDYFVIATGTNRRQIAAIAEEIRLALAGDEKRQLRPLNIAGRETAQWILMDYGSVVVHLFDEPTRRFYDLELLWGDSPKLDWRAAQAGLECK